MKARVLFINILLIFVAITFNSCDPPKTQKNGYSENPDAQAAFNRLTQNATNLPTSAALNKEINEATSTLHTAPCETCGLEVETNSRAPASFNYEGDYQLPAHCKVGNYDNIDKCREHFVKLIIAGGPDQYAKTRLDLPGGKFDVMNDAPTLPDGTYVNFTISEARSMAKSWGCKLPSYNQAASIRKYAEQQGTRKRARTRQWDNGIANNMTRMMTDSRMKEYAEDGKSQLINGHFKWYIDEKPNDKNFRFFGFYAPSACSQYCQDHGSSGGHGVGYIDYSQSARLICPAK